MGIKTTTPRSPRGREQKLYLFEKPLTEEVMRTEVDVPEEETLAAMLEKANQQYGKSRPSEKGKVDIPAWNRPVLGIPHTDFSALDPSFLKFVIMSALTAQAQRVGCSDPAREQVGLPDADRSVIPVTVGGIVKTIDDYLVLGVRRGLEGEQISTVPFGYARAQPRAQAVQKLGQPLWVNYFKESEEEAGIRPEEYSRVSALGAHLDVDFTQSWSAVFLAETELPFEEIEERHAKSLATYQRGEEEARSRGKVGREIRKVAKAAVAEGGHINVNAGDHQPLLKVENDLSAIISVIGAGEIDVPGEKAYPLMGLRQARLALYAQYLEKR